MSRTARRVRKEVDLEVDLEVELDVVSPGGRNWGRGRQPHFRSQEMLAEIEMMEENGYELASVDLPAESPDGYMEDLWEEDEYHAANCGGMSPVLMAMEMESDEEGDYEDASESQEDNGEGEEFYRLTADGSDVITPGSTRLTIYSAEINGEGGKKRLIDSGATSLYCGEKVVEQLGLKPRKIRPRKVKVADKATCVVDKVVTVPVKLGDLPVKNLTAYVFPLKDIDFVFGLPWLEHHNPHVD